MLPILGFPCSFLCGGTRDIRYGETGVFFLLNNELSQVKAEFTVDVFGLGVEEVVVKGAVFHDTLSGFHRDPDFEVLSEGI